MTDADTIALAGVINRLGASELSDVLKAIFERLEKIETEIFPAAEGQAADQTVPQSEEGTGALEEGSSSSNPESEPRPSQEQRQSY